MIPRRPLWTFLLAYLIPQPVLAFESGVNAMSAVNEAETQTLTSWAYNEFRDMVTGFRDMLDPILPPVSQSFNLLDAEIAQFIAQGQIEQSRLQEIIESSQPIEQETIQTDLPTMIASNAIADSDGFFYTPKNGELSEMPTLTFNEKGQLSLDTTKSINLPDLTFDPRDGGQYTSEIPVVQATLDQIQFVQDQVPAPIQSTGTDIYNAVIGYKPNAEH